MLTHTWTSLCLIGFCVCGQEYRILKRKHMVELAMAYFDSTMADHHSRLLVLKVCALLLSFASVTCVGDYTFHEHGGSPAPPLSYCRFWRRRFDSPPVRVIWLKTPRCAPGSAHKSRSDVCPRRRCPSISPDSAAAVARRVPAAEAPLAERRISRLCVGWWCCCGGCACKCPSTCR